MTALNKQIAGNHYKDLKIQPIEYIHANDIGKTRSFAANGRGANGRLHVPKRHCRAF